jgi:hypothetical protein
MPALAEHNGWKPMYKTFIKTFTALSLAMSLSACGGSKGESTPSGTTNALPTVTIAPPSEYQEGTTVVLAASASDSDGTIVSYQWTQTGGTQANLSATSSSNLSFVAPQVSISDTLTFQLTVKDNAGATASATTTIVVVDEAVQTAERAVAKLIELGALPDLDTTEDVSGKDEDSNGIRDDIDRFIQSLPVTTGQAEKLSTTAKYLQSAITVDPATRADGNEFAREMAQAQICVMYAFNDRKQARLYLRQIESYTANTYQRALQYNAYNQSRNGSVLRLPSPDNCQ